MDRRLENLNLRTIFTAVADLVLPGVCVVCGDELLPSESHICTCCLADIPLTGFWKMSRNPMADKFNSRIEAGECAAAERYAYACALYYYTYESPYDRISQSLKYWRAFETGRYFSGMLARRLEEAGHFKDVDVIVPIPLHWTRRLHRGYNQAEIIGGEISKALGVPCRPDILRRCRKTETQTELSGEDKESNVRDAFEASGRYGSYRHILLVDDIFTSGSTSYACFTALRRIYGTEVRISVATLGYVEDQSFSTSG